MTTITTQSMIEFMTPQMTSQFYCDNYITFNSSRDYNTVNYYKTYHSEFIRLWLREVFKISILIQDQLLLFHKNLFTIFYVRFEIYYIKIVHS